MSTELIKELWRRWCKRPKSRGLLDPASAALRDEGRGEVDEVSSEESEEDCEVLEEDMLGEDLHLRDPVDVARFCFAQEVPTQKSQFGPHTVSEVHLRIRELLGRSGLFFGITAVRRLTALAMRFYGCAREDLCAIWTHCVLWCWKCAGVLGESARHVASVISGVAR